MLELGDVVRILMVDFDPPKNKYHILIGKGEQSGEMCFATVIINSQINPNIFPSVSGMMDHFELDHSKYKSFLRHKSYVNCSEIMNYSEREIIDLVKADPTRVLGKLSVEDLRQIRDKLAQSETIKGKHKKRFGLFD